MRVCASEADVERFLQDFNALLRGEEPEFDLWRTAKNHRFLDAGFTKADVVRVIRSLRVENYSWGPKPDDKENRPPGHVWLFWAEFEGWDLYVKLKIEGSADGASMRAICLSCHEPESTIHRPYRRKGR